MNKHIAAGWSRNIPPASKYAIIFAGRNTHICQLCTAGLTEEEIEAHANLIASAPDLIKALTTYHNAAMAGRDPDKAMMEQAKAAIAKATGR
ncbi:hypothetical protein ABMY26_06610 (plasmid) [Azospirillum sp. HJ39]|uniref:hypothetical protein n=1 Tax=Azospirillum sp. HJ39 TaxID=3159496 RepID=UPI003555EC4F